MASSSEYIVIITIWVMTLAGVFFGGRTALRRKKQNREEKK